MTRTLLALAFAFTACGTSSESTSEPHPSTAPASTPQVATPTAPTQQSPSLPTPVSAGPDGVATRPAARVHATAAAPHTCVLDRATPLRVWPSPGAASVVARADAALVTGYSTDERGTTSVYVVSVRDDGRTTPLFRATLGGVTGDGTRIRTSAPTLLPLSSGRVLLLAVDARGTLLGTLLDGNLPTAGGAMRPIAQNVDLRFSPAAAEFDEHLFVSYTDGTRTPMRAFVVATDLSLNGAVSRDLTPAGMGGASPTWFNVESTPSLVFVDAHGGLSPLVLATARAGGATTDARVERALSTIAEPAQIAAGSIGQDSYVAYVAIGRAATSAVGLVKLGNTDPPVAIVPGVGYGSSHVSAAPIDHGIVFAADAPPTPDTHGARQLVLRVFDSQGLAPPTTIASPEPGANYVDVTEVAGSDVDLVWTTDVAVYFTSAHCSAL